MGEADGNRPSSRALVAQAATPEALAAVLVSERQRLRGASREQLQGSRGCRALTELSDGVIHRMLQLAFADDPTARDVLRPKIAVVATGGYGRRELCPYSDIDVTFIVSEEEDPDLDAVVRKMFLCLMEIFGQRAGLKVGYGYRTMSDAPQLDHQTQTALLDTRVVAGSHGLAERFQASVFRHLWPGAFARQKVRERAAVIEKLGDTLYRIEAEVREGPGGLRDIHLAEWLAAASFPSTRGDVWRQLQRLGAVTRRDVQEVTAAREFLLSVRTWMHWETGRAADLLVRERQEGLALALGFDDNDEASRVERFMEQFYAHAENVQRVCGFVADRCLSERLSLSDELACSGSELHPAYPWLKISTPHLLVELCQHYQEHGLTPGHELRRMIAQQIDACPELSVDGEAAQEFVGLLRAPPERSPGVHDTLVLMAGLGVLQQLFPEIGAAYRRVPFDQVHRHTIGHHALETVRSLEALRQTPDESLREFRGVWAEVAAPELLYLGALLHDIGKLSRKPGHAESGALTAREICGRLRLDAEATTRVEMLVRHHLLMSETAQLRDLTLDKTVQDFTSVVDSPDLLRMLLLLTYADIEATGVLSPVKVRFLEDLYFRAETALAGGGQPTPEEGAGAERARRFRSRLNRRLSAANLTAEQIRAHTEGMPVAYLLNTPPEQIALHIRMVDILRSNGPVVEFENDLGSDMTSVHLCTLESPEPGLLSRIAGVLYAHEVSVHAAQVFTRDADPAVALDTLWADYHGRTIPPFKRLELEQDLVAALKGADVEDAMRRCRKPLPPAIPPGRVEIDNELADGHTVVEIEAPDQPGLLYRITRALATLGWDIHSARISTRGDRARDAFYVTNRDGRKLDDEPAVLVERFVSEFSR